MKYILLLLLTGCASGPTEYSQGCSEGINQAWYPFADDNKIKETCNGLEYQHNKKLRTDPITHKEKL